MNYQNLPVKCYFVQNVATKEEIEFSEFEDADTCLNRKRSDNPSFEYRLIAEIDA